MRKEAKVKNCVRSLVNRVIELERNGSSESAGRFVVSVHMRAHHLLHSGLLDGSRCPAVRMRNPKRPITMRAVQKARMAPSWVPRCECGCIGGSLPPRMGPHGLWLTKSVKSCRCKRLTGCFKSQETHSGRERVTESD
jgi:hypothetical protein